MITIGHRPPASDDLVGHLLECHGRIRRFVALARTAGAASEGSDEIVEACAAVERYFERALPLHVEDEERSILPRLRGKRADVDEALGVMEAQHQAHQPLLEEMLAASRSLRERPGDSARRDRLRVAAERLSAEFAPHLELEESVVFPAIRSLLGPAVHAEIRAEQRQRRQPAPPDVP